MRRMIASILVGCVVGVVLHYAMYRMSLPQQPFVYMKF